MTGFKNTSPTLSKIHLLASLYLPFGSIFWVNRLLVYGHRYQIARVIARAWSMATYVMRVVLRLAILPFGVGGVYVFYINLKVTYSDYSATDTTALGLERAKAALLFCTVYGHLGFAFIMTILTVFVKGYRLRHPVNPRWSYVPAQPVVCKARPLPPALAFADPLMQRRFNDLNFLSAMFLIIDQEYVDCIVWLYNLAALVCADRPPSPSRLDVPAVAVLDLLFLVRQGAYFWFTLLAVCVWSVLFHFFDGSVWLMVAYVFWHRQTKFVEYLALQDVAFLNCEHYGDPSYAGLARGANPERIYSALVWNVTWKRALARPWLRDPLRTENVERSPIWKLLAAVTVGYVGWCTAVTAWDSWSANPHAYFLVIFKTALWCQMYIVYALLFACGITTWANILRFHVWHALKWIFSTTDRNTCPVS